MENEILTLYTTVFKVTLYIHYVIILSDWRNEKTVLVRLIGMMYFINFCWGFPIYVILNPKIYCYDNLR